MIEPVSCAISMRMNPDATFLIIRFHGIFHQCHDEPRRGPKATHYWNTSQYPNRHHELRIIHRQYTAFYCSTTHICATVNSY